MTNPARRSSHLSPALIAGAIDRIDPLFLDTPQYGSDVLSEALGRPVFVKDETGTPIGSFKGRGTWLLADTLDPARTWVCSTAGNFGQGLAYAAGARGANVEAYVSLDVPEAKVAGMRKLGAEVHVSERPEADARAAAEADGSVLVLDGEAPEMPIGAGTLALELDDLGPFDLAVVQVGDGSLISGVACWLKQRGTRVVGVCASGAPAMAQSFAAGRIVNTEGTGTIAAAMAISNPIPESFARVRKFVDDIVLVDDDDLRAAQGLISETVGVGVEPAGAAGVAALTRHGASLPSGRTAVVLSGAG